MCGLAGYFQTELLDTTHLQAMISSIAHRGPDHQGFHVDHNYDLGFSHSRLAIIDLSSQANQPLTYEQSGCWLIFNGAIYNYFELREELMHLGYQFKTEGDTEVLLAAYLQWGKTCLQRFNGMFAFALFDSRTKSLFLARDRYGIKPLYYLEFHKGILFASELKAFAAIHSKLNLSWDHQALNTLLRDTHELETSGYTLLKNVKTLLPGHQAIYANNRLQISRWWRTEDNLIDTPRTLKSQAEAFKELLFDACRLRLRTDVPFGVSLSGGLDSSSIAGTLKLLGEQPQTFVHRFDNEWLDETHLTEVLLKKYQLTGHYISKSALTFNDLDRAIYQYESAPRTILPHGASRIFAAQKQAGIRVTLDGHGADEMLAGYYWYVPIYRRSFSITSYQFYQLLKQQRAMGGYCPPNMLMRELLARLKLSYLLPKKNLAIQPSNFLQEAQLPVYKSSIGIPKNLLPLQKQLYSTFHATALPTTLRNFDRMSMEHAIEVRMPFLDYRLVNFVFSLPDASKIGKGYSKLVLREAMKGVLPDEIRLRKLKIPFANDSVAKPLKTDFRDWVETILNSPHELDDLISVAAMKKFYYQQLLTDRYHRDELGMFCACLNLIRLTQIFLPSL